MDILKTIIFCVKRPRIIFITGNGCEETALAVFSVLKKYFKVKIIQKAEPDFADALNNDIFIFKCHSEDEENFKKWISISKDPVFIATHTGKIELDKGFFAGSLEKAQEIKKLINALPLSSQLILNYDDDAIRSLIAEIKNFVSFGVGSRADFMASDIVLSQEKEAEGTNFKINYKGKVVPVWIKKGDRESIYATLAAAACGDALNINLVEISSALSGRAS